MLNHVTECIVLIYTFQFVPYCTFEIMKGGYLMQANKKPVKESANKKAKKDLAKIIESKIKDAKSVVIAEYRGLTVAEL